MLHNITYSYGWRKDANAAGRARRRGTARQAVDTMLFFVILNAGKDLNPLKIPVGSLRSA
jgi:hypothetical protein